jgi:uncharacterized membrane protein
VVVAFALYGVAGVLWLGAAALQMRMRRLSGEAASRGEKVGPEYERAQRLWMLLGVPAFVAAMATVVLMVRKPMLW